MTRIFDASSSDTLVPTDILRGLASRAEALSLKWVLVGAAARDLVIHTPLRSPPTRATSDVDIAVAVAVESDFRSFTEGLPTVQGIPHKFFFMGVELDVVPFGSIEDQGSVLLADGHRLDVVGLQEAADQPDLVRFERGLEVPVAPAELQVALKLLAWRDRHEDTNKDATDLRTILAAASEGVYAEEAWGDDEALEACDYMIDRAATYHFGRLAGERFTSQRSQPIFDMFLSLEMQQLQNQLHSPLSIDQLAAYKLGFERSQRPIGP